MGQQKSKHLRFKKNLNRPHIDFQACACYAVNLWNPEASLNISTAKK
jgi:hypothetical protein